MPADALIGDMADHLADARSRARDALGGEAHLGDVDDWRQSLVRARDGIMVVWLVWLAMRGLDLSVQTGPILLSAGLGISLYLGMSTSIATRLRLRFYESELERERLEIETNPEQEREEVRILYAAKGFQEPLLSQITDILCADDDRLLKLMMEEELGLFIRHINHPLLVGLWNGAGAAMATLVLATPVCFQPASTTRFWVPGAAAGLLIVLGFASARLTSRSAVEAIATWLGTAVVAGGFVYYFAALLAGQP